MLVMVVVVFIVHVLNGRPPMETLLFSVALAVGLSPELLPAILSVNLARGAQMMARHGVLVRRLNAIENLGSMDVLCTDKTGTLTEGVVELEGAYDALGVAVGRACAKLGAWNAALETGLPSPLDDAILRRGAPDLTARAKAGRDPVRLRPQAGQRGGARRKAGRRLITKGAFRHVLEICTRSADGHAARCRRASAPRGALPGLERTGDPRPGGRLTNDRTSSPRTAARRSGT